MSGTFEEIHPQGTRVTKVVYDDYEIVAEIKRLSSMQCNQDRWFFRPTVKGEM